MRIHTNVEKNERSSTEDVITIRSIWYHRICTGFPSSFLLSLPSFLLSLPFFLPFFHSSSSIIVSLFYRIEKTSLFIHATIYSLYDSHHTQLSGFTFRPVVFTFQFCLFPSSHFHFHDPFICSCCVITFNFPFFYIAFSILTHSPYLTT